VCVGGIHLCRSYVERSAKYRVCAPKLALPQPTPRWWRSEFNDQINQACSFANGVSIFDDSLLGEIAKGYGRCPWVKRVQWVRKQFPNRVEANIVIRWPRAAVAVNTGRGIVYYLVGGDGVRLPKEYRTWPQPGLNVPFITGVRVGPPRRGEPWAQDAVKEAIAIVETLRASDIINRGVNITAVDVSNYGGRINGARSEFLVLAENNCVIEWGRALSTDRPGELSVREKIAKFERFLAERNPTSNRTLDLRFAGRVVVSRRNHTDGDSI